MREISSPIPPARQPARAAIKAYSRSSDVFTQDRVPQGVFAFTNPRAAKVAFEAHSKRSKMGIVQAPRESAHARAAALLKTVDI